MNPELNDWQPKLIALASAAAGSDGAHDINHLHRVWRNAQALLDSHPQADRLVVMAGCYLHDLVNLPKNHPERAMASRHSAALACTELAAQGFPAARIGTVAHAIEAHSFSAAIEATSIEAQIVQDADRLDALGAVGLARLFYTAGQMGSALAHPDDPLAERRPRDDRAFALDHIEAKLAALPGMMQTAAGRTLGEERLGQLLAFRAGFANEWIGAGAAA
jgi:uncharacterized protein